MAFYDPMMIEVNVLLVDRDPNSLLETSNLLQINSYKVTAIQEATIASSILSQGGTKFDLVMIDVNSSDIEAYKLLHEAVRNRSIVILMSDDVNPTLAKCAIEDGAFLFLQKPATMDVLKYLWQHVLREKTRIIKQKGKFIEEDSEENLTANYIDTIEYGPINNNRSKGIRIEENTDSDLEIVNAVRPARRPKMCTEWTPELHERFMYAVRYLGEGRCFPKEILDLMNVPGLTRMQVASHLQKCRIGWQPPEERKPRGRGSKSPSTSGTGKSSNPKNKKYGLFPRQIRGLQPKLTEQENQNEEQVQAQDPSGSSDNNMGNSAPSPGVQDVGQQQGTFNSPASDNSTNNENSYENVSENANAVHGFQVLDMISFDFEVDNDQDVAGINFNMQDIDWDKVDPQQVANMANGDAEGFWSTWISSFAKEQ